MTGDTRLFAYASLATGALLVLAACSPPEKDECDAITPAQSAALTTPDPAKLAEHSPDEFRVRFVTSKGNFTVTAHRDWAPNGADRFHYLVSSGFFTDVRFFRAVKDFMVQFGISGTPAIAAVWENRGIQDEAVKTGNKRGNITYAMSSAPNSRTTQLFINLVDNTFLDSKGFSAFGEVTEGMAVVDSLYMGYGEAPSGAQGLIAQQGNAFLAKSFPQLDYIKCAGVVPAGG